MVECMVYGVMTYGVLSYDLDKPKIERHKSCFIINFRVAELITVSNSGREVHSALSGIARKYGLTYNPNVSLDGVRGAIDPHGLVVVTACGTLHNAAAASVCCGTFHQQFGLIRDPFDGNNWKIKVLRQEPKIKVDL